MEDLSHLRQSYEKSELSDAGLPEFPFELFAKWFNELRDFGKEPEINAMTLSTIGIDGYPKARVVLLKSFDDSGFVFFSNYESEKGQAMELEPKVCLSFFWPSMERQVIIKGSVSKIDDAESEAYFHSRPRGSQLGALASNQSLPVESRHKLDDRLKTLESEFEGRQIPKPEYWGGYKVQPESMEFWQGRANRMHDRILYVIEDGDWKQIRLQP
ncbi:pyridoxamine 5'-phosphate oxidase [Flavobacterium silvaticum]|uniref:Pyridoxine/pyridoxamine 5'-phosphate oxidase n=1 Tax=Flavobacterium silvaticum TaxID=1852020 RepID=A0A972JIZ3_9FLAO|nr:pyridoxamine 5'-phosphate oxidase [Flavobacterium silvaticum]NMH28813.1 pyridoxamine 5'-phosphate oxidase [Flavobacterium silvaticum]